MNYKQKQREKKSHLCLFVNKSAYNYNSELIEKLISEIKKQGNSYTLLEPDNAAELYYMTQIIIGKRKRRGPISSQIERRGPVTGLVACGGDGTFNLVARAGVAANKPVGILPMGRYNNIAMSVYKDLSKDPVAAILNRKITRSDIGIVGDQMFFGAIGFGFVVNLLELLKINSRPKFSLGWASLGAKASDHKLRKDTVLKIDSFRFELSPTLLSINLGPNIAGLKLSSLSQQSDGKAEIIFDVKQSKKEMGQFLKEIVKNKFVYGNDIRVFRGSAISVEPMKGERMYLDGEIVEIPDDRIDIIIEKDKLQLFA